jgi:hypothetical protein
MDSVEILLLVGLAANTVLAICCGIVAAKIINHLIDKRRQREK